MQAKLTHENLSSRKDTKNVKGMEQRAKRGLTTDSQDIHGFITTKYTNHTNLFSRKDAKIAKASCLNHDRKRTSRTVQILHY